MDRVKLFDSRLSSKNRTAKKTQALMGDMNKLNLCLVLYLKIFVPGCSAMVSQLTCEVLHTPTYSTMMND